MKPQTLEMQLDLVFIRGMKPKTLEVTDGFGLHKGDEARNARGD
ncbi:hypothetical protein [Bacillus salipaludis]|nr:hypothetical protein [Bacillus salipaludis]